MPSVNVQRGNVPPIVIVNDAYDHGHGVNGDGHVEDNRNNDGHQVDELARLAARINTDDNIIISDDVLDKLRREHIECYMLKDYLNGDSSMLRDQGFSYGAIYKLKEYFGIISAAPIVNEQRRDKSVNVVEYESKLYGFVLDELLQNESVTAQGLNKQAHGKVQGTTYKVAKAKAGGPAKVIRKVANKLKTLGIVRFDSVTCKNNGVGGDKHGNIKFSFTDSESLVKSITTENKDDFIILVKKYGLKQGWPKQFHWN